MGLDNREQCLNYEATNLTVFEIRDISVFGTEQLTFALWRGSRDLCAGHYTERLRVFDQAFCWPAECRLKNIVSTAADFAGLNIDLR